MEPQRRGMSWPNFRLEASERFPFATNMELDDQSEKYNLCLRDYWFARWLMTVQLTGFRLVMHNFTERAEVYLGWSICASYRSICASYSA